MDFFQSQPRASEVSKEANNVSNTQHIECNRCTFDNTCSVSYNNLIVFT